MRQRKQASPTEVRACLPQGPQMTPRRRCIGRRAGSGGSTAPTATTRCAAESKDCQVALDMGDTRHIESEWQDFQRAADSYAHMEDGPGSMFEAMDAKFDGVATKAGLTAAHDRLHAVEEAVDKALVAGAAAVLVAAWAEFAVAFEAHLKVANRVLVKTLLAQGDFEWALGWSLRKLVKHKPPTATRIYLWGLQHATTAEEYATFMPIIRAAVPDALFLPMAEEFKLGDPGKEQQQRPPSMARQSSQPADGTGAAYAGEAFGGPGATPPASVGLLARLKGYLAWANYQILGAVMGAPLTLKLLVQLVLSPRKTLRRVDRSALVLPDPLPGLAHHMIEVEEGVRLHAVRTSVRSGKPLMLFVHGFPEAWFSWRHQMEAFRDSHEVVAFDMRGYGESDKPKARSAYRLDRLAADVIAVSQHLLEECGQQQLVLVGHDWGANTCWAAAHTAPHLFSRLAIVCVPHPNCYFKNLAWDQFKRSWYVLAFQLPFIPEAALAANDFQMVEDIFTSPVFAPRRPGTFTKEDIERYKQAFGRPGAATAAVNYYRAMIDMNTRSPAPALQQALRRKLTVPTLLLWAENDPALGQQLLRGTDKYVDSLRVVVLPGCSHWAQQDAAQEVNRLLREHASSG
ncbi:epoxide hydrolase [Micractinium conductrix]|uniref:Epoxide hydrolase n=1 Tax=Micractinium conductrix TaxID=554055 RepID=A0A2P6VKZ8_9CHLO|nr:epoxide hydrolase [Micractinium conductrix]|eukprot:PSC74763.1 epoxide hydrolase [Micractinium conductrix]